MLNINENFSSNREIEDLVTVDECNNIIQNCKRVVSTAAGVSAMINCYSPSSKHLNSEIQEVYDCPRCSRIFASQNGIVSEKCGHRICKECIVDHFFKFQKGLMKCEFQSNGKLVCGKVIKENQIRSVLHEVGIHTITSDSQNEMTRNVANFWCGICSTDCPIGGGIRLGTCSHHICDDCLRRTIIKSSDSKIQCPYSRSYDGCEEYLTHSEIAGVTSEKEYEQFKLMLIKKATEPNELDQLMMMDDLKYIPNSEEFECPICFVPCAVNDGIKLRDCLHQLCLECFTNTIVHNEDESIACPFTDENLAHCESFIQEREIKAIVTKDLYDKFLDRKLKFAEHSITNTFHCKTIDCRGFGIIEEGDSQMICAICYNTNCLKCKAIHINQACENYQDSGGFKATELYIKELKDLGDVMNCPKCEALLNRIAGCSWIVCTFCKTEICWATRGPRWGPLGNGDLSGGCRCMVEGKRCHPTCANCH